MSEELRVATDLVRRKLGITLAAPDSLDFWRDLSSALREARIYSERARFEEVKCQELEELAARAAHLAGRDGTSSRVRRNVARTAGEIRNRNTGRMSQFRAAAG